MANFLQERGLRLSPTKTKISHIDQGFDFLGQNIKKYRGKLLIKPSKGSCKRLLEKVKRRLKSNKTAKQSKVISLLNPLIRAWSYYHRHVTAKDTFLEMDYRIHCKLWKWAKRRHRTKGAKWINKKYFPPPEKWGYFAARRKVGSDKTETIHLVRAGKIPIQRHREIKNASNPSDPCWPTYFQERQTWQLLKRLAKRPDWPALWKRQGGNCPVGKQRITKKMPWDLHHLHPKKEGGSDNPSNLLMLHPNCHRQVHNNTSVARWLTIMIERKEA